MLGPRLPFEGPVCSSMLLSSQWGAPAASLSSLQARFLFLDPQRLHLFSQPISSTVSSSGYFLSSPSPKLGKSQKGGPRPYFAFSGLGVSPEWQKVRNTWPMLSAAAAVGSVLGLVSELFKPMHASLYPGDAPSQLISSRFYQFAIDIIIYVFKHP